MNSVKLLPSDLWLEILRRIPAADLVPLKAVCKTFRRLISSDLFARIHLEYFTISKRAMIIQNPKTFHYDPDKRTISVWRDERRFDDWCSHESPHTHRHRVIDSYRGLILVQICDRLLLCNPITRSHKFLPSSQVNSGCWKIAYDDVSKQFKVFGLKRGKNEFSLYVIDVKREGELQSPRKITVMKLEKRFREYLRQIVLVNGSVYWLIIAATWENCATCIISANVATEEVKTRSCIFTPSYFMHNYDRVFFAANATFYHEQIGYPNSNYNFQLCVLEGLESENPNPSWMIKHRIENPRLSSISRYIGWHVIGVFRDKVLITASLVRPNELYQYDLSNEEFEKVTLARDDNNELIVVRFVNFHIIEHVDSLLSLGPIDDLLV